jgi:hypothetical protein
MEVVQLSQIGNGYYIIPPIVGQDIDTLRGVVQKP